MGAPLPPEVHALRGTKSEVGRIRQDRLKSPTVPTSRPKPPKHLSPEAVLEFKRVSKILAERRTETTGDFSILGVYAEVYSRWVSAKRTLADQGLEIECTLLDSNGQAHVNRKLNPMLKVVESCETKLLSLLKSLGLTPNSRETVKPAREKPRKTRGIVDL